MVGLASVALVVPAAAGAATKTVTMGPPPSVAKQFQREASDVNDYFPHRVTIRRGDSVRFVPAGFHTVDIPARGQDLQPVFAPSGKPVSGAVDAAGAPFWFNGQAEFGLNTALLDSKFGKRVTHDPSQRLQSGLPLQERPQPMTVRFKRTGLVTYLCDVHPGMKGVVRVVSRRRDVPSRKADQRAVRRQVRSRLALARHLAHQRVPAGVVNVGVAGRGGVERFEFQPSAITIDRGTALRFRMSSGSYEAHTATTGPGSPEDPSTYLGALTASLEQPVVHPALIYPSEPPPAVGSLTPALHGNGFWNSGVLDRDSRTPSPAENGVRFTEAGTYAFYCLIHPFMKATVTVR